MTTDLIPDSAGRADQGQGKQQERTHAEGPRKPQVPSKEEILGKLAQLPGLVAMGLWLLIAPGQLVKYPSDLDKHAVAEGTVSLFVEPETSTARAEPSDPIEQQG